MTTLTPEQTAEKLQKLSHGTGIDITTDEEREEAEKAAKEAEEQRQAEEKRQAEEADEDETETTETPGSKQITTSSGSRSTSSK